MSTPDQKKEVGIIRDFLRIEGFDLPHTKALELAAKLAGFRDLHQRQKARPPGSGELSLLRGLDPEDLRKSDLVEICLREIPTELEQADPFWREVSIEILRKMWGSLRPYAVEVGGGTYGRQRLLRTAWPLDLTEGELLEWGVCKAVALHARGLRFQRLSEGGRMSVCLAKGGQKEILTLSAVTFPKVLEELATRAQENALRWEIEGKVYDLRAGNREGDVFVEIRPDLVSLHKLHRKIAEAQGLSETIRQNLLWVTADWPAFEGQVVAPQRHPIYSECGVEWIKLVILLLDVGHPNNEAFAGAVQGLNRSDPFTRYALQIAWGLSDGSKDLAVVVQEVGLPEPVRTRFALSASFQAKHGTPLLHALKNLREHIQETIQLSEAA